jgi:hypothetical protein
MKVGLLETLELSSCNELEGNLLQEYLDSDGEVLMVQTFILCYLQLGCD